MASKYSKVLKVLRVFRHQSTQSTQHSVSAYAPPVHKILQVFRQLGALDAALTKGIQGLGTLAEPATETR